MPPRLQSPLARARTLAAALAALTLAAPSGARADGAEEFVHLLATLAPAATEADLAARSRRLARVAGAAASYLDVCREGALPGPGGAPLPLTAAQYRLLELAAPWLPRREVVRGIEERADGLDEGGRLTALELLRWHAAPNDLKLLVRLAAGEPADAGQPAELPEHGPLYDAFLAALVDLVKDDPRAMTHAADMEFGATSLRRALVRAVGTSGMVEGVPWLVQQLEVPELAPVALQEIGRLAPAVPLLETGKVAAQVRRYLDAPEASARRHAMRALADLRDPAAIPRLIEVLEFGASGERGSALSALRTLTGLGYPGEASVWRSWHSEELRWVAEEGPEVLERLDSDREADVVGAVSALSERSLYRDQLALKLAGLLRDHEAPAVRRQVCLALARLDSRAAVADLVFALGDPDEGVKSLAGRALRSITGLSLPAEREAWEDALAAGS